MATHTDPRPYIYLAIDQLAVIIYAIVIVKLVPTWLTSAKVSLWSIPVALQIMAIGTASVMVPKYKQLGRQVAIVGGSLLLLTTFIIIVRLLASAAFLAGVYGAFGKAAASGALIAVALVIEAVALLPIVQVKYLMSRAGRRVYV
ncbi:MAG: hypothetical protein ABI591_20345 [Kofleriaceae bacterium]